MELQEALKRHNDATTRTGPRAPRKRKAKPLPKKAEKKKGGVVKKRASMTMGTFKGK